MKWREPPRREAPHVLCGEGAALGPGQNSRGRNAHLPPASVTRPGPDIRGSGPLGIGGRPAHSPRGRVVLGPDADELVQVVRPQDGRVPCEVLEVVHDHSHEQVQHLQSGRRADNGASDGLLPHLSPSSQSLHDTIRVAEVTDQAGACPAASACPQQQWTLRPRPGP